LAIIITSMDRNITSQPRSLLSKLIAKQGEQSDYKFANYLQITRPLWALTRIGKLPIGFTLLKAIARTYPELNADVLNFLRDEDHAKELRE